MKKTLVIVTLVLMLSPIISLTTIFLITPSAYVRANPGVHVTVTNSPVGIGQPINIDYQTDENPSAIGLYIRSPAGGSDLWDHNIPYVVTGGVVYHETAPGISTPGTYIAGATEWPGAYPGPNVSGEFTFQVASGPPAGSPITIYVCLSGVNVGCGETIPVGQPFSIAYVLQSGYGGIGTAYVRTSSSYTHIWQETGIDLSWCVSTGCNGAVTASGISTPGSYVAGLSLALSGGGVTAGEMPFSVGTSTGGGFDFSLTLSPSSLSVTQGGTANYQIHITYSDPSFSGTTITIQDVAGLGLGMNYQIIPSPPGLHISTSQSTPTGSYTITLVGSAMGVVRHASAVLLVQTTEQPFDFSITVSPLDQTLVPGASVTYNVAVNLAAGTTQSVALSVPDAPGGVTAAFTQTSGSPPFTSILTVSASQSASPDKYALTVTGIGGGRSHTAPVALIIEQSPDFKIDVNPPSQTAVQGQTASYTVNVVGLNGFNSQISLTVAGFPAGVNGAFTTPSSLPDYSSTLIVTIPSNSQTGSFTLTITGSGGGTSRMANVILIINPAQTQPQTTQASSTLISSATTGGLQEALQQNSMIIIAALAALVILFALLAMRGRGGRRAPTQQTGPPRTFCGKCGTENPTSNEFCQNCGQKIGNS